VARLSFPNASVPPPKPTDAPMALLLPFGDRWMRGAVVETGVVFGGGVIVVGLALVVFSWRRRRRPVWQTAPALVTLVAFTWCSTGCTTVDTQRRQLESLPDRRYFHQGLSAGPTLITAPDGTVLDERRSEPFGHPIEEANPVADLHNTLNKEREPETDWSYHGARWMAPQTARWTAPDPPVKAPDPAFVAAPWSHHPYQFSLQDPTALWDPDGRSPAVQAGIMVESFLRAKAYKALEIALATPPSTNPGGSVKARFDWYWAAHQKIQNTPTANKVKWFGAAAVVTSSDGVGGAEKYWPFSLLLVGPTAQEFLRAGNEWFFGYNERNFTHLVKGKDIPGLEGLRGRMLDYAMVYLEQRLVERHIKRWFPASEYGDWQRKFAIDDINGMFGSFLGSADVNKVIQERMGGKMDFSKMEDRIMLGTGLINILYDDPERIETCPQCR
jgi:RHS repeat-associated protein